MVSTKKLWVLALLTMAVYLKGFAQIRPSQSLYAYNTMYVNPANTGILGKGSVFVWHRSQWVGFPGGPNTEMLAFEYPLKKVAFGLNAFYDHNNIVRQTHVSGYFSYLLNMSDNVFLSLGLNFGMENTGLDPSALNVKDSGESFFDGSTSALGLVGGIGATLYSGTWYVGISSPNILPHKVLATNASVATVQQFPLYFSSGVDVSLSYTIHWRPSLLMYYGEQLPFGFELTSNFIFKDKLLTGISYRFDSAYILHLGYKFSENFSLGYAFDWDAHELRRYDYGSHELFLRFEFDTRSERVRFQSPRFF